jgi:hypothetical protein
MNSYSYNTNESNSRQNPESELSVVRPPEINFFIDGSGVTEKKVISGCASFYPVTQKTENITSIDYYMNRRISPIMTQFRQYFKRPEHNFTAYRRHIETINIVGTNGFAQRTWTIRDGDILCNMYIKFPWNESGSVVLNYGGTKILDMDFTELYQLYRLYREKSNSIDLINFLICDEKGICICRRDLTLTINYNKPDFEFEMQVEYANLSDYERNLFISTPLEILF